MDPDAASSDLQRAASSEAPSSRPKPFDDSDIASRKRRRTSLSLSGSPSRSIDSLGPAADNSSTSATLDGDDEATDGVTEMDVGATPKTPERRSSSSDPPTNPPSSKVTINLRKTMAIDDEAGSSPVSQSPCPETSANPSDPAPDHGTNEELRNDSALKRTSVSASSRSSSPPIELIPMADEDIELDGSVEVVPIEHKLYLHDPTLQFPYHDSSQELLHETAQRLVNYLTNQSHPDEQVLANTQRWLELYVSFSKSADWRRVLDSCKANRAFWLQIPDAILALWIKRPPLHENIIYHDTLIGFYSAFTEVSGYFATLDIHVMQETLAQLPAGGTRCPDLLSTSYLRQTYMLARQKAVSEFDASLHTDGSQRKAVDSCFFGRLLQRSLGGNPGALQDFFVRLMELLPIFPRLIDSLAHGCQALSILAQEALRALLTGSELERGMDPASALEVTHRLWASISSCIKLLIEKHVTQLHPENLSLATMALAEVLKTCVQGTHQLATETTLEYRQRHPNLPSRYCPDAISLEWRFNILGTLIRCSQMQLRVMAVTTMCTELVAQWKNSGDDAHSPLLRHISDYLVRTELIEYIIGHNCHPEIIVESANIVGFLVVTKIYKSEHTDRLWRAIRTSQDPRVSDALTRMITTIINLFEYDSLMDLCGKLHTLPIESFNPAIRSLWDSLMCQITPKGSGDLRAVSYEPYDLCLRLLRDSSVCGTGTQVAHPDMQQLAMQKLRELWAHVPHEHSRAKLYKSCLEDVSKKGKTTLGSLWGLYVTILPTIDQDIEVLIEKHDLTRLIIEELEHAVAAGQASGVPAVLCGAPNEPRREFISSIIRLQSGKFDDSLTAKLWGHMVGPKCPCREDRAAGWNILNGVVKRSQAHNRFTNDCISRHLPQLSAEFFCEGMLEFVKAEALRLVTTEDFLADEEKATTYSCIEQLWRIIHTAGDSRLANQAIHILVVDVYMDSELLSSYSLHRRRQFHSSLVTRCLVQLRDAAEKINTSADGTASSDDGMIIVPTDQQAQEQELSFIRTLQLLQYFLQVSQTKPNLAAPDLRAFMGQPPSNIEGEVAQLKYQSFDGTQQTEVKPLNIGELNTGASLLASLREETGFSNYRMYYRGQQFLPDERQVCKSLHDLNIKEGLILVKREEDDTKGPAKIKPGSSPLQVEVLTHFQEMWDFLSMEEKFAREIYNFLVKLPADNQIMEQFENPTASHLDIFPPRQPFKCLYAIHALFEYRNLVRFTSPATRTVLGLHDFPRFSYEEARTHSISIIVQAISDKSIIEEIPDRLATQLRGGLMHILLQWLQDINLSEKHFDVTLLGISSPITFVSILTSAAHAADESSFHLIIHTFAVMLRLGVLDSNFWGALVAEPTFVAVVGNIVLLDKRKPLREASIKLIEDHIYLEDEPIFHGLNGKDVSDTPRSEHNLARFFWNFVVQLLSEASQNPNQCHELFSLTHYLLRSIFNNSKDEIDFHATAAQSSELLLRHQPLEDLNQDQPYDAVASGLASVILACMQADESVSRSPSLPGNLPQDLFWKLLYPLTRTYAEQAVPQVILNSETRARLGEILFRLVKDDCSKLKATLNLLNEVLPYYHLDEDDPYLYDIPSSFDRTKAIRASCGYVGLRNLSNTCYLNSLLTQLYMNTGFRNFLLSLRVEDNSEFQQPLQNTQKLFGHMQESYRRFVDPIDLVSSIKTYDDSPIDIHNQMDVDEFYNLLFDRWEGQLMTNRERKELRSFYGGQLVQQVKSLECEHISERLEPFSAIQCDIKGKNSLRDSLQTYVDGEVLGGDNKYKCSTCDRHVDAVKRACLKDLPDNMIFHLKRFDFNLRTLQRSKINDWFSFPTTIDLKPYTVDYLRDPEDNEPDIFELVGVLVHTGTAESGHYYSYIRERPSEAERPSWLEFNDDNVTHWDPASMESSTFGGPDSRPPFDANGMMFDKSYSAYMLFYERSTSLKKQQEDIEKVSAKLPLHVNIDQGQKEHILDENTVLLRRHCLFDPSHSLLVQRCIDRALTLDTAESSAPGLSESPQSSSATTKRSSSGLKILAMEVVLNHFDQIVTRKKDLPDFDAFSRLIEAAIHQSARCSLAFHEYFHLRPVALRSLVQRNPEQFVRDTTAQYFLTVLRKISAELPECYATMPTNDQELDGSFEYNMRRSSTTPAVPVVEGVMDIFRFLWRYFQFHLRAWDEHFKMVLGFASMGPQEVAQLLADDHLLKLIRIIAADPLLDLPANYARMLHNILRRLNNRPPSYEVIIQTIEYLLLQLEPGLGNSTIVDSAGERLLQTHPPFMWSSEEASSIISHPDPRQPSLFVEKLIGIDQAQQSTDNIITRLIHASENMDLSVLHVIRKNIRGDFSSQPLEPFLRAALRYLETTRYFPRAPKLVHYITKQAKDMSANDSTLLLSFFSSVLGIDRAGEGSSTLHDCCIDLMPEWVPVLLTHPMRDVRDVTTQLLEQELFSHSLGGDIADDDGLPAEKAFMVSTIQRLGVSCLAYLRDYYIMHRNQISRAHAESILKAAGRCAPLYEIVTETSETLSNDFAKLRAEVMDPLQRLIVDDLEEDGSDWEGSCASSEQMDGIAEMSVQAMNDLDEPNVA